MVIGSWSTIGLGRAAEFDYAGTGLAVVKERKVYEVVWLTPTYSHHDGQGRCPDRVYTNLIRLGL